MRRFLGTIFTRRFLATLLAISILSNLVLLTRLTHPDEWRRFSLSFKRPPAIRADDHVRGPASAITVIEYGDFECPFCAGMHEVMRELAASGDVRWVYRHYPITAIHAHALPAAEAAECAGEQGSFWSYADSLSARHDEMAETDFVALAGTMGLDPHRFDDCMRMARHRPKVLRQVEEARAISVEATPTFFVGSERYEGFASAVELRHQLGLPRDRLPDSGVLGRPLSSLLKPFDARP